jgi:hypothetical protein
MIMLLLCIGAWGQTNPIAEPVNEDSTLTPTSHTGVDQSVSSSKNNIGDPLDLRASLDPVPLSKFHTLAITPAIVAAPVLPVKPKTVDNNESRKKKIWFSLSMVNHGAATFDAWSTRSAIGRGAQEVNPLLKPFATSNAMYAAVQVVPFGMDYLGRRMMRSNNSVVRKMWWLPQTASAICGLTAGIHNMGVNSR